MKLSFQKLALLAVVGLAVPTGCAETDPPSPESQQTGCSGPQDCGPGYVCNTNSGVCESTDNNGGGEDTKSGPDHECQQDGDCPNGNCQFNGSRRVCRPSEDPDPDVTDPIEDTSQEDTRPPEDTGRDSTDGYSEETDSDDEDTTSGTSFSGCESDSDCASYQTCNTDLGRCEDARPSCSSDADCSDGVCVAGRCAASCQDEDPTDNTPPSCSNDELTCVTVGENNVCLTTCDKDNSDFDACAPDSQCLPIQGEDLGICRGVGRKSNGESCSDDFSAGDCQSGSYCLTRRGESQCVPLCYESSQSPCDSGKSCNPIFPDPETPSKSAGVCETNCGGLGQAQDSLCSGEKACQPTSDSWGICVKPGTAGLDQSCQYSSSPYCETGSSCVPTGPDAAVGNATSGMCKSLCDPSNQSSCPTSETCLKIPDREGIGLCYDKCDPLKATSDNSCSSGRPRCLPVGVNETSPAAGFCSAAGNKSDGASCNLQSEAFACGPDSICAVPDSMFGGSNQQGACTQSCVAFSNPGGDQCGSDAACGVRFFSSKIGFCSTNTTDGSSVGDTCSMTNSWCGDSLFCYPWEGSATTPTCQIPCLDSVDDTCPSGQSCQVVQQDTGFGYCN